MRTVSIYYLVLLIMIMAVLSGCNSAPDKYPEHEIARINIPEVNINRFDSALFSGERDNFTNHLKSLFPEFRIFLSDTIPTSAGFIELSDFVNDPVIISTSGEVSKTFPDLNKLTKELTFAFKHLKYHIPEFQVPQVYTYISGYDFEHPVIYSDSMLIIGLDNYLGSQYPFYTRLNFPKYKIARMRDAYITRDCMNQIAEFMLRSTNTEKRLIDHMIFEGKKLYFMELMLPQAHDTILTGYTESQLKWCDQYRKNMWAYIIDSKLMYETDTKKTSRILNDGPYSNDFGKDSAPRIGVYIGWQIVKKFMARNPEYHLVDLIKEVDSQKILANSKYKP